jgi:hypothetical protein
MAVMSLCLVLPGHAQDSSQPTAVTQPPAQNPAPTLAPAPAPDEELAFFRGTDISGFVDVYYNFNSIRPAGDTQLRNFDNKSNQFGLNLVQLAFEKKPDAQQRTGFRLDLNAGPATDLIHASEPGGAETYKYIQQAYVSYLAPVGKGLQVDFGIFVTPHGAEVIYSRDNWNYSRSLLFALAIPYYHAGLRTSYSINDKVSFSLFLVNGWNNVAENNSGKTGGVQMTVKPTGKLSLTQSWMGGPEQAGNNHDRRHLLDTLVTYNLHPKLSLMANYDYGMDRIAGQHVHWQGIAVYARLSPSPRIILTPRYEYLADQNGFMTGTSQKVQEFTLTGEHSFSRWLTGKAEYRRDQAGVPYFLAGDNTLRKSQSTIGFGMIFAFDTKWK